MIGGCDGTRHAGTDLPTPDFMQYAAADSAATRPSAGLRPPNGLRRAGFLQNCNASPAN
jgi:hypothetical protein